MQDTPDETNARAAAVALHWTFDDGGRKAAGYRGTAGDCVTRAIAIVTDLDYETAYQLVNTTAKSEKPRNGARRSNAREGVSKRTTRRTLAGLGWQWHPTMQIGSGCKTHLRADELPGGRILVQLSHHVSAVINGVVHDIYDPSRDGTRCVYGYWAEGETA
jgi:hypothetical protein